MIIPTGHKVLVKLDPVEQKSKEGIILYTDSQENMHKVGIQRGLVLANGPSAWKAFREVEEGKEVNGRPWAKVGDYVLFAKFAGRFIDDPFQDSEDGHFMIMNDEDIIAILVDGKNETPDNSFRDKVVKEGVEPNE
jgi:co-chaperonin GroES (HSP10)